MYLSKLRITGFKSFPNRVEVNFPVDGITSVVGPNGCGKSNIIDAIRWVLGEQRPKALRSSKMEDVIFSGTAERAPTNMAEVSLLIHNEGGVLPSDYTQVQITRRTYRDGDSEYLINNQPCRLKDIHNLFYDTGMGAASYSLIEAKMIDTILSDKAEERRVMFEEAAGISKYKQQRKETLRQLERTAADLARVEDSLRHVQQNVNLFERQARKAEKWREARSACRALELSFQYDSYLRLSVESESLKLGQAKDENRMAELDARRAAEEAILEQERLGLFEEEQQVSVLSRKAAETRNEAIRIEGEVERGRDRVGHLGESLRRLRAEAAESRVRLQELERQESETVLDTEALLKILSGIAENAMAGRGKLEAAMLRWQEARSETDALGQGRIEALEDASALKQRLAAAEAEWAHLRDAEIEANQDFEARGIRLADRSLERESAVKELAESESEVAKARAEFSQAARAESEMGQLLESAMSRLQELQKEKVAWETRKNILAGLEASREGIDSGVKHLLGSAKDRFRSLWIDALQVPADLTDCVERALGKSLQVVLVDNPDRGQELLATLRDAKKGEAVFGWPEAKFRRERPNLNGKPGFRGWLIEKITAPPEWQAILEWSLGQHAVVENLESARVLMSELAGRDIWLWTPDGTGVHAGGLMVGGVKSGEGSGLLHRKAELQDAAAALARLLGSVKSAEAEISALQDRRKSESGRMEEWTRKIRDAEQQGHALRSRLQIATSQAGALEEEIEHAKRKLSSLAERKTPLTQQSEALRGEWKIAEESRQGLENRYQVSVEKARERETERRTLEEAWRSLEQSRAEAEGRLQAARTRAEYLKKAQAETHEALERSARQGEEWEFQSTLQREGIESLAAEIAAIHERLTIEERDRDAVKSVYDSKAGGLEEKRTVLRALQDELRELTRETHERSLKLEHARSGMQSIRERMFEIHEVDLGVSEPAFERVEYDPATAPDQIAEYKEKLRSFGNINTGAVEEYEAEKARLDEVEKQFGDLDRARQGLERAIKKLDKAAREQFLTTFALVQKNFQEVFSSLFEGGEAQLALEEGADSLDAKIEINARPTGKKMRGVSLLSGGERALTAISLLFALYLVRPSPYCIMDEVDGPLDDANIGRFVGLLRRFSHQTQFIVVTHNKRTMAASDMLYGVTQEIKGISKLVSVQLDEAARIAA